MLSSGDRKLNKLVRLLKIVTRPKQQWERNGLAQTNTAGPKRLEMSCTLCEDLGMLRNKRTTSFLALAVTSAASLALNSNATQAVSKTPQSISGKQKITWSVGGDCVDLYDEYQTEYLIYEGEDCYFSVKVVPALPIRTVALQVKGENGRWYSERQTKTNKQGVATLRPDTSDSDGYFLCDYYDYRLGVARLGNAKSVLSQTFSIEFIADDDYCY